ncbi:hypothetical protein [Streptomyces sp. S1D4-20]|uniref:hypothetical protein n=1 Tax=Streptomyces sp. S1D4-20 TaxID=2594462 RepID=UPI0011646BF5|nr:hypothetical protein [Streptomyces sp. S1D4-20]QDN54093.1 hypothetical protein FNV67_00495 [Streptomyces sp. S1D4-20]
MAPRGATQPKTAAESYALALETAGLLADAIEKRYDRSASGYAAALTSLSALHQLQLARECDNCQGSGVVDGDSCPNVVAHLAA